MMNRFKVAVPAFNCSLYLPKCLRSLEFQTIQEFDVCIVDDASTDPLQLALIKDYCSHNNWNYIVNGENCGSLCGLSQAIEQLQPDDEDVICVLDGDDWFFSPRTLALIKEAYEQDIYLTYGGVTSYPTGLLDHDISDPAPAADWIENQEYRDHPWRYGAPHTFKYYLWKHLNSEDLKDQRGEYFKVCADRARFYPLLELAGPKMARLTDILYVYNLQNPLNEHKVRPEQQQKALEEILKKPRHASLFPFPSKQGKA